MDLHVPLQVGFPLKDFTAHFAVPDDFMHPPSIVSAMLAMSV